MTNEEAFRFLAVVKTTLECAVLAFALFSMLQARHDRREAAATLNETRAVVKTLSETPCVVPTLDAETR